MCGISIACKSKTTYDAIAFLAFLIQYYRQPREDGNALALSQSGNKALEPVNMCPGVNFALNGLVQSKHSIAD